MDGLGNGEGVPNGFTFIHIGFDKNVGNVFLLG